MGLREWGEKFSLIFVGYETVFLSEFSVFIGPRWRFFTDVAAFRFAEVAASYSRSVFREFGVTSSSLIWRASSN